jgi:hypothetical protein
VNTILYKSATETEDCLHVYHSTNISGKGFLHFSYKTNFSRVAKSGERKFCLCCSHCKIITQVMPMSLFLGLLSKNTWKGMCWTCWYAVWMLHNFYDKVFDVWLNWRHDNSATFFHLSQDLLHQMQAGSGIISIFSTVLIAI